MNTVFTHLNNIIHYKKDDKAIESDSSYNQYMINRWVSMYSPQMATIVNHTTNIYWPILTSKYDHHKFLLGVIPKSKIFRINYIKKRKQSKSDTDGLVKQLAKELELSQREINYYITSNNIDVEMLKKICP